MCRYDIQICVCGFTARFAQPTEYCKLSILGAQCKASEIHKPEDLPADSIGQGHFMVPYAFNGDCTDEMHRQLAFYARFIGYKIAGVLHHKKVDMWRGQLGNFRKEYNTITQNNKSNANNQDHAFLKSFFGDGGDASKLTTEIESYEGLARQWDFHINGFYSKHIERCVSNTHFLNSTSPAERSNAYHRALANFQTMMIIQQKCQEPLDRVEKALDSLAITTGVKRIALKPKKRPEVYTFGNEILETTFDELDRDMIGDKFMQDFEPVASYTTKQQWYDIRNVDAPTVPNVKGCDGEYTPADRNL